MAKLEAVTLIAGLFALMWSHGNSRASHKVHNLALYPERHSWCQVTPIKQEVSHLPECYSKTIDNNVCMGACFSYSVPKAQDDPAIPPYCDACRPTVSEWTVVVLNCTKKETGEYYQALQNVEIISNCSCVDCNDSKPRVTKVEESSDSPEEDSTEDEANEVDAYDHTGKKHSLLDFPTLKKLKSTSAERNRIHNAEEIMLKQNRIPDDQDLAEEDPRGVE